MDAPPKIKRKYAVWKRKYGFDDELMTKVIADFNGGESCSECWRGYPPDLVWYDGEYKVFMKKCIDVMWVDNVATYTGFICRGCNYYRNKKW